MTDRYGIDASYTDGFGERREVPASTLAALREAMGEDPGDAAVRVARRGAALGPGRLVLEDGGELRVGRRLPRDLPYGYHRFAPDRGEEVELIVSPGRCPLPRERMWGWVAQLHAARSRESWGLGDLADLRRLARWSAEELGAGLLLVNPLGAPIPATPVQPSPYFPSSRRWRNPLYLRIEELPGADRLGQRLGRLAATGRALNADRHIDRDAVWRLKMEALETLWSPGGADPAFAAWRRRQGRSLEDFAIYCALVEHHGGGWPSWPQAYRRPGSAAVARFAAERAERVAFFAWLQWLLDRQLAAASTSLALVHDLPVGFDPEGADAWQWQDQLARGVRIGAPPDRFNGDGQDWGLPPFVPWRLRRSGYRPFAETIRAALAHAGGVRIDHVMALFRLFWIPEGGEPGDGAYVRYPADELLDVLALEAHRAGAFVVGEDLGTVEPGVRRQLARRNVLSYRLLWFEERPPRRWPRKAMAAVTTHDLPTVAGLWGGSDLEVQRELGLPADEAGTAAIRRTLARRGRVARDAPAAEAVLAAHRLLSETPCLLLTATLEDALAVTERPNHPGSHAGPGGWPNWSLALPRSLEQLEQEPLVRAVADALTDRRGADPDARRSAGRGAG